MPIIGMNHSSARYVSQRLANMSLTALARADGGVVIQADRKGAGMRMQGLI